MRVWGANPCTIVILTRWLVQITVIGFWCLWWIFLGRNDVPKDCLECFACDSSTEVWLMTHCVMSEYSHKILAYSKVGNPSNWRNARFWIGNLFKRHEPGPCCFHSPWFLHGSIKFTVYAKNALLHWTTILFDLAWVSRHEFFINWVCFMLWINSVFVPTSYNSFNIVSVLTALKKMKRGFTKNLQSTRTSIIISRTA